VARIDLKNNRKLQISLVLVIAILLVGGWLIVRTMHSAPERKVTFKAKQKDDPTFDEPFYQPPKQSKSEVCEKISAQKIEAILKVKTKGARISLPNTTNHQGTVSGCTYQVQDNEQSVVSYVSITTRVFDDAVKAQESFTRLRGSNKEESVGGAVQYLQKGSAQLVRLKGASLSTITVAKTTSRSQGVEQILRGIAALL
jgi:hypothetical protein